jgi:hypothetical protein
VAAHTISGQRWADGTTVSVYPAAAWPDPTQAPSGSAVTTAAVAGGAVTFAGLAENVRYVAYAGGLGVRFVVPQVNPTDARSLRQRVDELTGDIQPKVGSPTVTDYTPTWRDGVGMTVWVRPTLLNPYSSEYGVTGDGTTDDRVGLQAALNRGSVLKAGVGLAETDHMISSGVLTLPSAVPLVGQGAASRLLQGYWTADAPLISATGSLGTSTLITTNAQDNGGFTLAVASTTGLAANDWVMIGSSANFNTTPKGELSRVKSIDSSTQITLWGMMRDQYLTADSAYVRKVNFVRNVELRDLAIVNTSPERLASAGAPLATFTYCRGVETNGLYLSGSDSAGVRLDSCIDASVDGGVFEDFADSNANNWFGYGVELRGATDGAKVHGVTFRRVRHGVTTSTGGAAVGLPRNCVIEACIGDATTAPAFDTHEDCDNITFDGCSVTNVRGGFAAFQLRGKNLKVLNPVVSWCSVGVNILFTVSGAEIKGGSMRHLPVSGTGGNAFQIGSAQGVTIDGVTMEHMADHAISVPGSSPDRLTVTRCRILNVGSGKNGIHFGDTSAATNVVIERNHLLD